MPFLNTSQKIAVATALYRLVAAGRKLFGKSDVVFARRSGIYWDLNLKEGIDFSIYLLGGFEPATLRLYGTLLSEGCIALDIGANIGAHTLPLAQLTGEAGKVYAFEPTQYAFNKLRCNVELNPNLKGRIELVNAMLVRDSRQTTTTDVYSSWPLTKQEGLHEQHGGKLMSTFGAEAMSLDDFVVRKKLSRIDFIKLDVDGNEIDVLTGGLATIEQFRPIMLMELAPYLFENDMDKLETIVSHIFALNYVVKEAATRRLLPNNLRALCARVPTGGSMNILFEPRG